MSSPSRNRTAFFAAALTLLLVLALPGAGLAADSSEAGGSEGSSAGSDPGDGSVFCDPASLSEGEICVLTPDKEQDDSDAPAQAPAAEASAERPPVSAADPGEVETGGDETAGGVSATRTGDAEGIALARTGFRAWLPAVLGAYLLLGGVGLLAARRRLHR